MTDPSSVTAIIISAASGIVGYLYGFATTSVRTLASGDQTAITALVTQLVLFYIALMIVRRTAGMVYGMLVFFFKLAIVTLLLATALYASNNGVEKTFHDVSVWINRQAYELVSSANVHDHVLRGWKTYKPHVSLAQKWLGQTVEGYKERLAQQFE